MMFNLTDYISYLFVNDPAMLLVQFVILPCGIIGGLVCLSSWYSERKKRKWVNSTSKVNI